MIAVAVIKRLLRRFQLELTHRFFYRVDFGEISFILLYYSVLMAKGMCCGEFSDQATADVYPRDNCIARTLSL